jgi:hypothetical protein
VASFGSALALSLVGTAVALQVIAPRLAVPVFIAGIAVSGLMAGTLAVITVRDAVISRRVTPGLARRTTLDRLERFAGPDESWTATPDWGLTALWGRPAAERSVTFDNPPRVALIGRGRPAPFQLVRRLQADDEARHRRLA